MYTIYLLSLLRSQHMCVFLSGRRRQFTSCAEGAERSSFPRGACARRFTLAVSSPCLLHAVHGLQPAAPLSVDALFLYARLSLCVLPLFVHAVRCSHRASAAFWSSSCCDRASSAHVCSCCIDSLSVEETRLPRLLHSVSQLRCVW